MNGTGPILLPCSQQLVISLLKVNHLEEIHNFGGCPFMIPITPYKVMVGLGVITGNWSFKDVTGLIDGMAVTIANLNNVDEEDDVTVVR